MALTKLTSNLIEGGTGTDWVTAIQTSNFTAAAGKGYFVNTTSQVLYVNLPVGVVGMEITIQDYAGTFATNKVILNANGSEKIQGSALEGKINTNNATAVLIYQDATKGWTSQDVSLNATEISWATPTGQSLTYTQPNPQSSVGAAAATFPTTTFTATKAGNIISGTATIAGLPSGITAAQTITGSGGGNTLTVTLTGTFSATDYLNTNLTLSGLTLTLPPFDTYYLVIAGGGGGSSAGGGAGGLRTSYTNTSSLNGHNESSLALSVATNYTVTVGLGGSGSQVDTVSQSSGTNSTFSGSFTGSPITSTGGGRGGTIGDVGLTALAGGSGGGGGSFGTTQTYGAAAVTSPVTQGYAGGGNNNFTPSPHPSGGGGGANSVGSNATSSNTSGNGGAGLEVNIIGGTGNFYAGGGGGGTYALTSNYGTGGTGGGGDGIGTSAGQGTSNTGGGGGGGNAMGGGAAYPGQTGGSGVVILRYPSGYTISGLSGTTITVGSDKVTTFTAGTGTIQFN